ncbi:MAG: hypothetical protein V4551_06415 [Pseudomonadota bacterium]
MIALTFAQLRKIDSDAPETPFLSSALSRARSRLLLASMRGDGSGF